MSDLGLGEDQGEDLTQWAQYYFESDYAKEWLQENEPWMDPRTVAAIKRGLELKPEDANPIP